MVGARGVRAFQVYQPVALGLIRPHGAAVKAGDQCRFSSPELSAKAQRQETIDYHGLTSQARCSLEPQSLDATPPEQNVGGGWTSISEFSLENRLVLCTVATPGRRNYTHVLLDDIARHEPEAAVVVLWLGPDQDIFSPGVSATPSVVLTTRDLGIGKDELDELRASRLPDQEYALALRPWLLHAALRSGASVATFVADDVHLLGSLGAVHARAGVVGACFLRKSPPLLAARGQSAAGGTELPAIDLDLMAVTAAADSFLSDWEGATVRWCQDRGFRASQHVDASADRFPGALLADPVVDFGWWNWNILSARRGPDPRELGVVALHLHGFDAWRPHLISLEADAISSLRLSRWPRLAYLCHEYAARVRTAGPLPPGYGPWSVLVDTDRHHQAHLSPTAPHEDVFALRCLQHAREAANLGRWPAPPDPDHCDRSTWMAWLNSPPEGSRANVSRYLLEVYKARRDVRLTFPTLEMDPAPFLNWARTHGHRELHIPPELLPIQGRTRPVRGDVPPPAGFGVNVIGLFESHLGIGEAARQLLSALDAARVPYRTWDYGPVESPHFAGGPGLLRDGSLYRINVLCLNPPELANLIHHAGPALRHNRYNIGVWAWETESVPATWLKETRLVDEVWAPSRYVAAAFGGGTQTMVRVVPHAVSLPEHPSYMDRGYLGLPGAYLFLFMFDFNSSVLRKNALGLVRAYRAAFAPGEAALVIKTLNAATHAGDWEELLLEVGEREDILVHDRVLTPIERAALLDACDCYISLHRSEGFGLTLAEAMALGKPVIATAYSGNLDFMTPQNSFLVGYQRCVVGVPWDRYPADHVWAEPDLNEAVEAMRRVWLDRTEAARRGAAAQVEMRERLAPEVVGAQIRARLEAVSNSASRDGRRRRSASQVLRRVRRVAGRRLAGSGK